MDNISVLLVDDEVLMRQGLRKMLEQEPFVKTVLEAGNMQEFSHQLSIHQVDFILMDIKLQNENGFELIQILKQSEQKPRVIAVTGMEGVELIVNLLKAGCVGIVYKLDGYKEIIKTICALLEGDTYFPEGIVKIIKANAKRWDNTPTILLSFNEKELLRAISKGGTTKQIAKELRLKFTTAETYRIRLMKKVGAPNTASLLAYAYRNGLL